MHQIPQNATPPDPQPTGLHPKIQPGKPYIRPEAVLENDGGAKTAELTGEAYRFEEVKGPQRQPGIMSKRATASSENLSLPSPSPLRASLAAQIAKNLSAMWETLVQL